MPAPGVDVPASACVAKRFTKDTATFFVVFWINDTSASTVCCPNQAKTLNEIETFCARTPAGYGDVLADITTAIVSLLYHKSKKFTDRSLLVTKVSLDPITARLLRAKLQTTFSLLAQPRCTKRDLSC